MARMLRDWTDSEKVNSLSIHAEVFFTRLIMKADDFGSYHANPQLLKGTLFPLKPTVRSADISLYLTECEKAGLIALYTHAGKQYLRIANYGQRLRNYRNRFPDPPPEVIKKLSREGPLEVEEELEVEKELEGVCELLFESIKKFFGYESEINHINKWQKIKAFINRLSEEKKIHYFNKQFDFYKKYKSFAQEKIHGFESFISDGWDSENWEHKYNECKKTNNKNGSDVDLVYRKPPHKDYEAETKRLLEKAVKGFPNWRV